MTQKVLLSAYGKSYYKGKELQKAIDYIDANNLFYLKFGWENIITS